jgi:hypothetical protein
MPDYVEGFGSLKEPLKLVAEVDFTKLALSAQEGFVLSRVDGATSGALICEMSGLGRDGTLEILKNLRNKGVIVVGNEAPIKPPEEPSPADSSPALASEEQLSDEQRGQLDLEELDGINLQREVRAKILLIYPRLADMTFFELLAVPVDCDSKKVRRAYFKRSKEFHPDRYYAKNIGHYKEKLEKIFAQMKSANEFLQDETKRNEYRKMIEEEAERERISADLEQHLRSYATQAPDLRSHAMPRRHRICVLMPRRHRICVLMPRRHRICVLMPRRHRICVLMPRRHRISRKSDAHRRLRARGSPRSNELAPRAVSITTRLGLATRRPSWE